MNSHKKSTVRWTYEGPPFRHPAIGRTEEVLAVAIHPLLGTVQSAWLDLQDYEIREVGAGPPGINAIFSIILERKFDMPGRKTEDNLWNRLITVEAECELIDRKTGRPFADFSHAEREAVLRQRMNGWVRSRVEDILRLKETEPDLLPCAVYVSAGTLATLGATADPLEMYMIDGARRLMAAAMRGQRRVRIKLIMIPEEYGVLLGPGIRNRVQSRVKSLSWFGAYQAIEVAGLQGRRSLNRMNLIDLSLFRNRSVIDFGCNLGQMSIATAIAGASRILGVDGMTDTLEAAGAIKELVGLPTLDYLLTDFNAADFDGVINGAFPGKADYTFFLSVYRTKELTQRERLFDYVLEKTGTACFFEGHADPKIDTDEYYRKLFEDFGVPAEYLGFGEPNLRPLYMLDVTRRRRTFQIAAGSHSVGSEASAVAPQAPRETAANPAETETVSPSASTGTALPLSELKRPPTVALVYFTCNRLDYTKLSLKALLERTHYPFELHIVDNGSTDTTCEYLLEQRELHPEVIRSITFNETNRGLAAPTSEFWERADADLVGKVDNDTIVCDGWLTRLVEAHLKSERMGVIGGFHFRSDDVNHELLEDRIVEVDGVKLLRDHHIGGCCYLMKREVQNLLGPIIVQGGKKIMGWTEYQHALDASGYLNGYLYPLLFVDHMDDPRSPNCLLQSNYLDYAKTVWKERKIQVEDERIVSEWIRRDARRAMTGESLRQAEPLEAKLRRPLPHLAPIQTMPPGAGHSGNAVTSDPEKMMIGKQVTGETPSDKPLVSIVIPNYNQADYLLACLESIRRHTSEPHEIIIVDNGSTDHAPERAKQLGWNEIQVIENESNIGFGPACNQGIRAARGKYIVLLNNDTLVTEGWLERMRNAAHSDPRLGLVGPRSNYVSHAVQFDGPATYHDPDSLEAYARELARNNRDRLEYVDRLVFFCVLIKRDLIEDIGLMDEGYAIGNFEDDDYCMLAKSRGWKLAVAQDAFIHHFGSRTFFAIDDGSLHRDRMIANGRLFARKWGIDPDSYQASIKRPPTILLVDTKLEDFHGDSPLRTADDLYHRATEYLGRGDAISALRGYMRAIAFDHTHMPTLDALHQIAPKLPEQLMIQLDSSLQSLNHPDGRHDKEALRQDRNAAEAIAVEPKIQQNEPEMVSGPDSAGRSMTTLSSNRPLLSIVLLDQTDKPLRALRETIHELDLEENTFEMVIVTQRTENEIRSELKETPINIVRTESGNEMQRTLSGCIGSGGKYVLPMNHGSAINFTCLHNVLEEIVKTGKSEVLYGHLPISLTMDEELQTNNGICKVSGKRLLPAIVRQRRIPFSGCIISRELFLSFNDVDNGVGELAWEKFLVSQADKITIGMLSEPLAREETILLATESSREEWLRLLRTTVELHGGEPATVQTSLVYPSNWPRDGMAAIVDSFLRLGATEEALTLTETTLAEKPNVELMTLIGRLLLNDNMQTALTYLDAALDQDPLHMPLFNIFRGLEGKLPPEWLSQREEKILQLFQTAGSHENQHREMMKLSQFMDAPRAVNFAKQTIEHKRLEKPDRPGEITPGISIIVPMYNARDYVVEALESILHQTFTDYECIVVDDCSADDSVSVVEKWIAERGDERFRMLKRQHEGPSATRNAGLREASGRFISCIDADDSFAPDFLRLSREALEAEPDVGWVYPLTLQYGKFNRLWGTDEFHPLSFLAMNRCPSAALQRREVWEDTGGFCESMLDGYEDWDYWISAMEHGWRGAGLDRILFFYRKRIDSRNESIEDNSEIEIKLDMIHRHPRAYRQIQEYEFPYLQIPRCIGPEVIRMDFLDYWKKRNLDLRKRSSNSSIRSRERTERKSTIMIARKPA